MSLTAQVALVSEIAAVKPQQLMKVAAALQKQVTRDVSPIWGIHATVDAFASLDDVEIGYWPIIVVEDVPNAAGVHLDQDGQPYALVEFGNSWSLTASHECVEMLIDPFGDRLVAGRSPKPGQGRVEFLVEACDPSEAAQFAYTVNGVLVSDFYTPQFFDPVPAFGVRYGFGPHLRSPRKILKGGYISWHDPVSNHWFQQTWFGGPAPKYRDLGVFSASDPRSIREIIDSKTPELIRLSHVGPSEAMYKDSVKALQGIDASTSARSKRLREQIRALTRAGRASAGAERGRSGRKAYKK